jgi:hypothetical protein
VADQFKVTDPATGSSMTYNGLLTGHSDGTPAAAPYQWSHTWTSDENNNPMTLTAGNGDALIADGARETRILPGTSAEQFIDTYPTLVPAGRAPRHFHRVIHRTMTISGDTVAISVDATETQLDLSRTWVRQGNHTLYRENPTKVVVNGQSLVTNPDLHTCAVDLIDVVHDLGQRVPVQGQAVITYDDGRVYTIEFTGACSLFWEDNRGHSGHFNYCQWDSFRD